MKNPPFFIVGLPRSRTAWLANFLTVGNSFCFHELEAGCENNAEIQNEFEQKTRFYDNVGNSSSGLAFVGEYFLRKYPDSRWVFIERPIPEVNASLQRTFSTKRDFTPEIAWLACNINVLKKKIQGNQKTFEFHNLNDNWKLDQIFQFCLPKEFCDESRLRALQNLKIEIIPEKWAKRLNRRFRECFPLCA